MIEEFIQILARLASLKKGHFWRDAGWAVDEELQKLVRAGSEAVAQMSETELLARIIEGEPTQVVHQKALLLTTLLKESGEIAAAQDQSEESRACYLKGLNLLLETLARAEPADFPDFVPTVDVFLDALRDSPLPLGTQARLMQHYERLGQFGKAEDALCAMLESEPEEPRLLDFGITFYQRLQNQSDSNLIAGNLPRAEVDLGLAALQRVKT